MPFIKLNQEAIGRIQQLIEANFAGRDELYAAANLLDDDGRQQVCHRLAEHLAAHAAELQQIVCDCGNEPAAPLDIESIAYALFDLAKLNRGESGMLDAAAEGERNLKSAYDRAIAATTNPDAEEMLRRQRNEVEIGECILLVMSDTESHSSGESANR